LYLAERLYLAEAPHLFHGQYNYIKKGSKQSREERRSKKKKRKETEGEREREREREGKD
jgi:hypothetical protein